MFCSECGSKSSLAGNQFCTRCGHDLAPKAKPGSHQAGVRQGMNLIAVGIVMIPISMFVGAAFPPNDRFVEAAPSTTPAEMVSWILMWMAFLAGSMRIGYALLFEKERSLSVASTPETGSSGVETRQNNSLPAGDTFEPVPGSWITTDELVARRK